MSWGELPAGRVVHLAGIDADAIELSFDSLPVDAPAIVTYSAGESDSVQEMVEGVLRELEILAVALFPAWLPEGDMGPTPARWA